MAFDLPIQNGVLQTGARRGKTVGDLLKDAVRQGNMSGGHGANGLFLKIEFIGRVDDAIAQRYPQRGTQIRMAGADTQPSVLVIDDVQWVQLDSWQCRFTFNFRAARLGEGGEDVAEPAEKVFEMAVGVRIEETTEPARIFIQNPFAGAGQGVYRDGVNYYQVHYRTRTITISESRETRHLSGILLSITAPTGVTYTGRLANATGKQNTNTAGWVFTYELENFAAKYLLRREVTDNRPTVFSGVGI